MVLSAETLPVIVNAFPYQFTEENTRSFAGIQGE